MATNRIVLLQLGTLCFVLLMLMPAAHGNKGVLILYGTARCKSNPSKTINNATLQVAINGTIVAAGETNGAGRFFLEANVTSRNQLVALTRKEVTIMVPPGACDGGVPATTAGRKLAAVADLSGPDGDVVEIPDLGMIILRGNDSDIVGQLVDDDHLPVEFSEDALDFIDRHPQIFQL